MSKARKIMATLTIFLQEKKNYTLLFKKIKDLY